MKETILLFNPPEKDRLLKLEMALFPLHVRLKKVVPSEYNQPLGVLAGIKDMTPAEGIYDGPNFRIPCSSSAFSTTAGSTRRLPP